MDAPPPKECPTTDSSPPTTEAPITDAHCPIPFTCPYHPPYPYGYLYGGPPYRSYGALPP